MKKIQDQISDVLYERLSSPFVHTFILSWLFFNRHLILYLFNSSDEDYLVKRRMIDSMINIMDWLVNPLFGSLIALLIYVGASWVFHTIWEWFIVQKQNSRSRIRKIQRIDVEHEKKLNDIINLLQDELDSQREKYELRLSAKDSDLGRLATENQREIERKVKDFDSLQKEHNKVVEQKEKIIKSLESHKIKLEREKDSLSSELLKKRKLSLFDYATSELENNPVFRNLEDFKLENYEKPQDLLLALSSGQKKKLWAILAGIVVDNLNGLSDEGKIIAKNLGLYEIKDGRIGVSEAGKQIAISLVNSMEN